MAALLKWKEPRAVTDYEFKHEGLPALKNMFWLFGKWSVILGIPVTYVTWRWMPEALLPALRGLLICGTFLPAAFSLQFWLSCKMGIHYQIDKKGLLRFFGDKARRYFWKDIESYRFDDYPNIPDIRQLIISVTFRQKKFEREFRFDPQQVNEQTLAELLRQHLPQAPGPTTN